MSEVSKTEEPQTGDGEMVHLKGELKRNMRCMYVRTYVYHTHMQSSWTT